jgi:hypothetical protein
MIYLVLAIVFSTFNHLLFKAFSRFRVDLLVAIVANYSVCVAIGYISSYESVAVSLSAVFQQDWYPFSILQGGLLVTCLFLIGRTTERQGVAVASLATRLSVAIPTVTAFFLYHDMVTAPKMMGIIVALLALYLSSVNAKGVNRSVIRFRSSLPLILFGAFGLHSLLLKFVQAKFLVGTSYHVYVMTAFLWAWILSGAILIWRLLKKQQACRWRDLASGALLGCTNYGAIYCLIKALSVPGWQSSQLFPTMSIAVVSLSSFGAWAIFKERIHQRMLVALAIGAVSIILIYL